jgi:hypothetical protein
MGKTGNEPTDGYAQRADGQENGRPDFVHQAAGGNIASAAGKSVDGGDQQRLEVGQAESRTNGGEKGARKGSQQVVAEVRHDEPRQAFPHKRVSLFKSPVRVKGGVRFCTTHSILSGTGRLKKEYHHI